MVGYWFRKLADELERVAALRRDADTDRVLRVVARALRVVAADDYLDAAGNE